MRTDRQHEWLETDGLGGYSMGTASGVRTRRYHGVLLAALQPPSDRWMLVNGWDAWVVTPTGEFAISTQAYVNGVMHPDGATSLESFTHEPWPTWVFTLPDGMRIEHQMVRRHGVPVAVLSWKLLEKRKGVTLRVRPLLSGRDPHGLQHANSAFSFVRHEADTLTWWAPYAGVPHTLTLANAQYEPAPEWLRGFSYAVETKRGLEGVEDLASPGTFTFDLSAREADWLVAASTTATRELFTGADAGTLARSLRRREAERRKRFASPLERAGDAYLVKRGGNLSVIAGYPWFGDWGRDTFIAMRGLCLATDRLDDARQMLLAWAGAVSQGMLPNRFADAGDTPEYNAVDASLWYVIAAGEWLDAMANAERRVTGPTQGALRGAIEAILRGYSGGTRFGIRMDADALIMQGEPGVQLTWMDAKVDDWVVTPRIGKPVEIQALWLNALLVGARWEQHWRQVAARVRASFLERFWSESHGHLFDVVDVDHEPGKVDASLRPNQLFALGGLPEVLIEGERARKAVEACERALWTPFGPRSLAPEDPKYRGTMAGSVHDRDGAYHNGTVWPWLSGAFVESWVRVRGGTSAAKREARERFLAVLQGQLAAAGLGHLTEVADGDAPHAPQGCPFQAWSVSELIRLECAVLAEPRQPLARRRSR
ncbi:MAG: amylo-alpha-1,6-glucosidase [Candidatus Eisenbacteria bacterium]